MTSTLSKAIACALFSIATLGASVAFAHGAAPAQHGGVVQSANDLSFELVPGANGATLYVDDHDADYDTKKMSGKLTVLNGTQKSEADLTPAGGNKLEAKGITIAKGARVVAAITEGGMSLTVRFTVK